MLLQVSCCVFCPSGSWLGRVVWIKQFSQDVMYVLPRDVTAKNKQTVFAFLLSFSLFGHQHAWPAPSWHNSRILPAGDQTVRRLLSPRSRINRASRGALAGPINFGRPNVPTRRVAWLKKRVHRFDLGEITIGRQSSRENRADTMCVKREASYSRHQWAWWNNCGSVVSYSKNVEQD